MPDTTQEYERPLTGREAAQFLQIHYGTLLRLAREGKIPAHPIDPTRANKRWRFFVSELQSALVCPCKPVPSKKGK